MLSHRGAPLSHLLIYLCCHTGVPHFIVEGRYHVGGAQEAETFEELFDEVLERRQR